jgi:hypothetical protein
MTITTAFLFLNDLSQVALLVGRAIAKVASGI